MLCPHAADRLRAVRRLRGAHGGRGAQHADRRHVGHVPTGGGQRGLRVAVRPDPRVRRIHAHGRHAATVQPVAYRPVDGATQGPAVQQVRRRDEITGPRRQDVRW